MEHATSKQEELIHKAVDFIMRYATYTDINEVEGWVRKHIEYKTILIVEDDGVVAVCRWNILPAGDTAHVLDLIIREDYRDRGLLQRVLLQGLKMYPSVKRLIFERGYDDGMIKKPLKTINVSDFFRVYRGVDDVGKNKKTV